MLRILDGDPNADLLDSDVFAKPVVLRGHDLKAFESLSLPRMSREDVERLIVRFGYKTRKHIKLWWGFSVRTTQSMNELKEAMIKTTEHLLRDVYHVDHACAKFGDVPQDEDEYDGVIAAYNTVDEADHNKKITIVYDDRVFTSLPMLRIVEYVLHEVAHAITIRKVYGKGLRFPTREQAHGLFWQNVACAIGCSIHYEFHRTCPLELIMHPLGAKCENESDDDCCAIPTREVERRGVVLTEPEYLRDVVIYNGNWTCERHGKMYRLLRHYMRACVA